MRIQVFVLLFFTAFSYAQKNSKVLISINKEKVTVADFKSVYEKNLSLIEEKSEKDVEKNVNLYIDYKLKVAEAYRRKLDTLPFFKREVETYKNQLLEPYLRDEKYLAFLEKEAYNRYKENIRASHILVKILQEASPKDTMQAYEKITKARQRIINGESFEKVAKEISEDRSAKTNGGDLGYFSAFKMIYKFETAAYNTPVNTVSKPFRTSFGYHIVKVTDRQLSKGDLQVAHILITDKSKKGKEKIDSIKNLLKNGADFNSLAKQFSNDTNSKDIGGVLPRFGKGSMLPALEKASFSLDLVGQLSEPFQTRFGWHVVKLIEKFPITTYNEMKDEIKRKVRESGRLKLSENAVLDRLKSKYSIKVDRKGKKILQHPNLRNLPKDSLQHLLLSINDKKIIQQDFVNYIVNRRQYPIDKLFDKFIDKEVLAYYKENLSVTQPEYAKALQEYKDGILLFEFMQRNVWKKAVNDTIALKKYYDENIKKYSNKNFKEVKGVVINDFQSFLEQELHKDLRSKASIKINKKALRKLIKYYASKQ